MARTKETATVAEPSTVEKIADLITEIRARREEVNRLDEQSAKLAATDTERSIEADQRARAVERFIERRQLVLEDLIKTRHAEEFSERDAAVDALAAQEIEKAKALAESLRTASTAFFEAARTLAGIGAYSPPNIPPGLSGPSLLGWEAGQKLPSESPFLRKIERGLAFRIDSLRRAAENVKRMARDPGFMPVNPVDGIEFVSLRDKLPAFAPEEFIVEESETVDLLPNMASGTN